MIIARYFLEIIAEEKRCYIPLHGIQRLEITGNTVEVFCNDNPRVLVNNVTNIDAIVDQMNEAEVPYADSD